MISDIEALGTPVVIVDVENESQFVYRAANQLALAYYHVRKEVIIGRNVEDYRGLSDIQVRGFKYNLSLYRRCVKLRSAITMTTRSDFDDGRQKWAKHTLAPLFVDDGIAQIIVTTVEISDLKRSQQDLSLALTRVLSGFVTICAWCQDIKDKDQRWQRIEEYASTQMDYHEFSHGLCPTCAAKQAAALDREVLAE